MTKLLAGRLAINFNSLITTFLGVLFLFSFETAVHSQTCDVIYVDAANGNDSNSGINIEPVKSLKKAISLVSSSRNHIKMTTGFYSENSIIELVDNLVIEGSFTNSSGVWYKTSNSGGVTSISLSGRETINNDIAHVMGFKSEGKKNWKLIDLTILTTDASGHTLSRRGLSNYAVYIGAGSANYEVTRCNIFSGNATNGQGRDTHSSDFNGGDGSNGSIGGTGSGGQSRCQYDNGGNGGTGGAGGMGGLNGLSSSYAPSGFTGGNGGDGRNDNDTGGGNGSSRTGTCSSGGGALGSNDGNNYYTPFGGDGEDCNVDGDIGNNSTTTNSASYNSGFYLPGFGEDGTPGQGGGGGAGGGGGGRDTGVCNSAGGGGSGGSGGGGGGGAGAGGRGGGSSYGVFIWNAGAGGVINNSFINTGAFGVRGRGGIGGQGGSGGSKSDQGNTSFDEQSNRGGRGGAGSDGGKGGNGADGTDGERVAVSVRGSGVNPTFNNVSPTIIVNSSTSGGNVSSSPRIVFNEIPNKICQNSVLNISTDNGPWILPTGWAFVKYNNTTVASEFNTASTTGDITTTHTNGFYNITADNIVFNSYLNVRSQRDLPVITADPSPVCAGGTLVLSATSWGNEIEYKWEIFNATNAPNKGVSTNLIYSSSAVSPTIPVPTSIQSTVTYLIRYQVKEECCGWSIPVFKKITIDVPPGNPAAFGDNIWNVYGYNGNSTNLNNNQYRGFYVQPDLGGGNYGIDTEEFWRPDKSPEIAGVPENTGNLWKGCSVENNNHTFVHKRKGFPCGNYTFKFLNWDDETRLYIDGNPVWGCSTWDANGGANGGTSINAIYSCPTRDFTFALNADSEVEFQTFENSGNADLGVVITKITPQSLASTAISDRTCPTRGADWVDFLDDDNKLIASINPNNRDLGNVTVKSYLSSPQVMKDCNIPNNTLYHTAYMGRSWVVVSDVYPAGQGFNSDVSIRLPFTNAELDGLNTTAQNTTTGNPLDGGTSNPVTASNIMLTKITGATENGVANQADCASTIRAVQSTGFGANYLSINNTKYVEFDIQQFSEFFLHKNNDGSALPVNLTNFSASCDEVVSIHWTTASEQNSDYFVVEKSRDGQNWVFVAEQNAAGNSSEVINYTQLDENISGELTYYRLRQIDYDGKEEVFGPISVMCKVEKTIGMKVYPNPNDGAFTLEVLSEKSFSDVQLTLNDLSGKVAFSQKANINSGVTQFYFNEIGLQKGVYIISLNGQMISIKPVKVMID